MKKPHSSDFGFVSSAGRTAAHFHPRAPKIWLCLGDTLRELRLYNQALFYYQRMTELEPTNELAIQRQNDCTGSVYGLMKLFQRGSLQTRWKKAVDKAMGRE